MRKICPHPRPLPHRNGRGESDNGKDEEADQFLLCSSFSCSPLSFRWGRGRGWGLLLFLLLLAFPLPARPQISYARPQALVVIADHLTLADVTRPDLPGLTEMRRAGQMALMSPGLAKPPDPVAAAFASLGAGDSIGTGDKSQGLIADALRRAGVRTALLGNADGDDTGPYQPALLLLPTPDVVNHGGLVLDPLAPGGRRQDPARLWAATQTALRSADLVVVDFGDFERLERENQRGFLLPAAYAQHRKRDLRALDTYLGLIRGGFHGPVFVAVPTPPQMPDGSWNALTPFLALNIAPPDAPSSVMSDTTQTPGLVAARDLAPTLLAVLQVPRPVQMTGAPVHPAQVSSTALARLDRLVRLNQEAQNAIFWTVGFGASAIVFSGLALYFAGRLKGRIGAAARYGLRIISAWPLALLLAPLAGPHSVSAYLWEIAACVGLLALLPSPAVIFSVTAVLLTLDGLTGTRLISSSALSEYALSGIRFYGIGNEYMGVLIGGTLLAAPWFLPRYRNPALLTWAERVKAPSPSEQARRAALLFGFVFVTFVLSFPAFGAKAGGAITATATFVVAWRLLFSRPVRWTHLVGSVALGFALVFIWAGLSHILHLRRTHLETAADALGSGRFGYIAGVSLRKIGLAGRVLLHPGTLLGLLAFAGIGVVLRRLLRRQVAAYLTARPRELAVLKAGLWGCLVALLFNDSGIVAAILILQCLALLLLHGLYGAGSEAQEIVFPA